MKRRCNEFQAGLSRSWYNKGRKSGRSGRYSSMYDAWSVAKKKASKIPGQYVTQQESFYQGYIDAEEARGNPRSKRFAASPRGIVKAVRAALRAQREGKRVKISVRTKR